ncbi:hypothetical protein ACFL1N_17430 [Thermodesulfobacteriota bacterium]
MVKKLLIVFLLIAGFAFPGCNSTHKTINLSKLSDKEIKAYNNNPDNTIKIVCRKERSIGTRIPKRICRMQASMDKRSLEDQEALKRIQSTVRPLE